MVSPTEPQSARQLSSWSALAYGLTMLGSTALHSCFMTYYVQVFMHRFSVSPSSFVTAQLLFGLWNALNDPLFGWLSDSIAWAGGSPLSRRAKAIAAGGLVWAAAFLSVWWPWGSGDSLGELAHMVVSLCAYDAALTWVEVNHGAALAEMTRDQGDRARANAWAGVCAAAGSAASWLAHLGWTSSSGLKTFRLVCILTAAVACAAFLVSAKGIADAKPPKAGHRATSVAQPEARSPEERTRCCSQPISFAAQLVKSSSFRIFAVVAAVQAFDCAFEKNFFGSFLGAFAGAPEQGGMGAESQATIVSLSFLLPHVVTVALTPTIRSLGLYSVLHGIFVARSAFLLFGVAVTAMNGMMPTLGLPAGWTQGLFMLTNRVASESVCRLFPIAIGDITDETVASQLVGERQRAATVVGSSLLLGRLTSSLAPLFGFQLVQTATNSAGGADGAMRALLLVPLCCVVAQLVLWQFYSLHGARLREIKQRATLVEAGGKCPDV